MLPATFKLCAAISYQHLRNVTGESPMPRILLSAQLLSALSGLGDGGCMMFPVGLQLWSGQSLFSCSQAVACSPCATWICFHPPVSQWEEASLIGTSTEGLGTSRQGRLFQPDTTQLCCDVLSDFRAAQTSCSGHQPGAQQAVVPQRGAQHVDQPGPQAKLSAQ